jgi:hypothetical protein
MWRDNDYLSSRWLERTASRLTNDHPYGGAAAPARIASRGAAVALTAVGAGVDGGAAQGVTGRRVRASETAPYRRYLPGQVS